MIFCDFLTGFLGSGKTTLLNRLLKNKNPYHFAIIVNEFGEVGLDQWVYKQISDNVYLLDSGCLCCTLTHSLRETLMEVHNYAIQKKIEKELKVVIESSGLADPLPVLHSLIGDPVLKPHFQLASVIATIDVINAAYQLSNYSESVRQVMAADHLILTKTDLSEEAEFNELSSRLSELNPFAQIIVSSNSKLVDDVFSQRQNESFSFLKSSQSNSNLNLSSLTLGHRPFYSGATRHTSNSNSWARFIDFKVTWPGLSAWWEIVKNEYGNRLLRCKGLISMSDSSSNLMIHGVGMYFHNPTKLENWPDSDARGRLVCIGIGLDCDFLDASLRALTISESYAKPKNLVELSHLLDE